MDRQTSKETTEALVSALALARARIAPKRPTQRPMMPCGLKGCTATSNTRGGYCCREHAMEARNADRAKRGFGPKKVRV